MAWNNGLTKLQYELADLYFRDERIRSVAVEAGIPQEVLNLSGAPISDWYNVLREAANRDKVANLVDIAASEFPSKTDTLNAALAEHEQGVGATAAALAEFNRSLSSNLRNLLVSLAVAILTAWIMASFGGYFFSHGMVVILLFSIILFTPFLVRALFTRLRIQIGITGLIVISALLMLGETVLFSEIVGGSRLQIESVQGDVPAAEYQGQMLRGKESQKDICQLEENQDCIEAADEECICYNLVKVGGDKSESIIQVQTENKWEAPTATVQLIIQWTKREATPGFRRNYQGRMAFQYQYLCENGNTPSDVRLIKRDAWLAPGEGVLTRVIGFIEIPFMRELDNTIERNVTKVLKLVPLCGEKYEQ